MSKSTRIFILLVAIVLYAVGIYYGGESSHETQPAAQAVESEQSGHGETASAKEEHPSKVPDLIKRTLNFGAVLFLLIYLLKKPVSQALKNRTKNIKEELNGLETKRKEAESKLNEALERLKKVQDEKDKVIQTFIEQGESEKIRILEEAENMARHLKEQAMKSIDQEVDKAKNEIQIEVAEKAALRALELIQANINESDRDRLVDDYLKQVAG